MVHYLPVSWQVFTIIQSTNLQLHARPRSGSHSSPSVQSVEPSEIQVDELFINSALRAPTLREMTQAAIPTSSWKQNTPKIWWDDATQRCRCRSSSHSSDRWISTTIKSRKKFDKSAWTCEFPTSPCSRRGLLHRLRHRHRPTHKVQISSQKSAKRP